MDIASYIEDLLWDYECVIVPGFGGILTTYRHAEMILAEHIIYPPSKSLAFNEYLNNNDGLLINHICNKDRVSYAEASEKVENWVRLTRSLLHDKEEIYLPKIGRFHRDIEKNLRFIPDTTINYLSSSYGLKKVLAEPVLRGKSADTIETLEPHRASYALPRSNKTWAMAAVIILFLVLGSLLDLMYQGVDVKPLNLNAASVLSMLEVFDKKAEPIAEPKPSISKNVPPLSAEENVPAVMAISPSPAADNPASPQPADNNTGSISSPVTDQGENGSATGKKYYIIIGAYEKRYNFRHAENYLKGTHRGEEIYEDTSLEKKRIGFYAGDNYPEALRRLEEARKDRQDYWLLVKK